MIDTIRILSKIDKETYEKIYSQSIIKKSFSAKTGQLYYEITSDNLEGSFSSSLYCRVYDRGDRYLFDDYVIVIEGSAHKLAYGQNAYNGFNDLEFVVLYLKSLVENGYNVKLPGYESWFLLRCDVAKCFDLENQNRVCNYINNLSNLDFPRRNLKFYIDSCIYFTGTTTTLKIYNKLLEFKSHDKSKLSKRDDFNINEHEEKIKGFVRFEVEIKKKKLLSLYEKIYNCIVKNVRCIDFDYNILNCVWCDEFMKVLKLNYTDLKKISDKDCVKRRLLRVFGDRYGIDLYNFYLSLVIDGCKSVKNSTAKSTYYRKLNDLKNLGIDFTSNKISVVYNNENDFVDIFNMKEVV